MENTSTKYERVLAVVAGWAHYSVSPEEIAHRIMPQIHVDDRTNTIEGLPAAINSLRATQPELFQTPGVNTAEHDRLAKLFGDAVAANKLARENIAQYRELRDRARQLGIIR